MTKFPLIEELAKGKSDDFEYRINSERTFRQNSK